MSLTPMNIDVTMQESTTLAITMYASETGLSKRVAQWEEKIKPILNNEVFHVLMILWWNLSIRTTLN